jgi:hypothetical protein
MFTSSVKSGPGRTLKNSARLGLRTGTVVRTFSTSTSPSESIRNCERSASGLGGGSVSGPLPFREYCSVVGGVFVTKRLSLAIGLMV